MSISWPLVKLSDVLLPSKEIAEIDSKEEYKEITVRLWGKGVNLRGIKRGNDFGTGKRFIASENQFIMSKIDARHGAYGVIPEFLNGGLVTADFPLFSAIPEKLNVDYLNWLSKSPWFIDECKRASKGTTNRKRLKTDLFLDIKINLPSIQEQNKIVDKLNRFQAKINESTDLRKSLLIDAEALLSSTFSELISCAKYKSMSELAPIVRRKVEVSIETEYPELGVRSFGKGTFHKPILNGIDVGNKKLYKIEPNDLLFSNVFAWEGAIAVVQSADKGRVGSHRFISCVAKENLITSGFLCFYLLSKEGMEKIREASPGGAGRNRTLGLKKLEKIEVPIPDYQEQLKFNKLQQKVSDIKNAQKENKKELEALMPSILDKAFKGELI